MALALLLGASMIPFKHHDTGLDLDTDATCGPVQNLACGHHVGPQHVSWSLVGCGYSLVRILPSP
jgi:hypothetical protein